MGFTTTASNIRSGRSRRTENAKSRLKKAMAILITNRQNQHPVHRNQIKRTAQVVLDGLGYPDAELSLLIVDDAEITRLNQIYLNRKGPTNVIAFPMQEGEHGNVSPGLLGDVVISMETAAAESGLAEISLEHRFNQLLIHGILHLLGFDHEKDPQEAAIMEAKSEELMTRIASLSE